MAATHRNPTPAPGAPVKNVDRELTTATKFTDGASGEFEFGGSLGAASLMTGFPLLMWYMWIGATYYDGKLLLPESNQSWTDFGTHLLQLMSEKSRICLSR